MNFIKFFSCLLSPPFCAACRVMLNDYDVLCDVCKKNIKPLVTGLLKINSFLTIPVYSISSYQEPLVSLIRAKNYGHPVASKQLGTLLCNMAAINNTSFDVIVSIPLHWTRQLWRGFNQSEIMARELSKHLNVPLVGLIQRNRHTSFQSILRGVERQENVRNIFSLKKESSDYSGKHILIVDDVMTTGSTLKEAAKILTTIKPASITAVVAARVVD